MPAARAQPSRRLSGPALFSQASGSRIVWLRRVQAIHFSHKPVKTNSPHPAARSARKRHDKTSCLTSCFVVGLIGDMAPLRSQPGAAFVIGKGGGGEQADGVFLPMAKKRRSKVNFAPTWCGWRESNPHAHTDTSTSSLPVYQFQHSRRSQQLNKLPDYYIAFGPVCQLNFFSRTQKNSEKSVDTGDILW